MQSARKERQRVGAYIEKRNEEVKDERTDA
jgi:hypothetical protein